MKSQNLLISVVIPVYNRPDALRNTLASVIKQSYDNLEILVVDDGSDIDIHPIVLEKYRDKEQLDEIYKTIKSSYEHLTEEYAKELSINKVHKFGEII